MGISNFSGSLAVGKKAERLAVAVFKRWGNRVVDVRADPLYQKMDVDYVVAGELYEVKQNLHTAQKGRPGYFFWVELSVGEKPGWWFFTKADRFMFFTPDGKSYVLVDVEGIRERVERAIVEENHDPESLYRYDFKEDYRYGGPVWAKSMRVYLSEVEGSYKHYRVVAG
jgi:hypothetical protein